MKTYSPVASFLSIHITYLLRMSIFIITMVSKLIHTRNIFKKIYDEVTEDIFDMSNVRILKKLRIKNGGCLYFVLSIVS